MEKVRYQISGCAAHSRLVPLLPSHWVDDSPYSRLSATTTSNAAPDFLWENAPRRETRAYRDEVKCYSHLPNGTAVLDDKWALARLFSINAYEKVSPHFATLQSFCFRGITGFQSFCDRVNMDRMEDQDPCADGQFGQFPDLLDETDKTAAGISIPPAPSNLWVVKDANSNGAGGIWIVGPQNASEFTDAATTPLLEEHRYVAQRYAWPPLLYGGRKCHIRVYGLITSDGRAFVHKRAFLHVANEKFSYPSKDEASEFCDAVHITNCCANSHDESKFAGEICADMETTDFGMYQGQTIVPLADFSPSISASVAELSRRALPFLRGGEANNGFEYLGMDFILSYDMDNMPVAYMLEVNAPPSQDTATGLSHAESLHNDVIRDILTLWVFPKVTSNATENAGGWKCVYNDRGDNVSDSAMIVPSKAAILNKIRWAIYERKSSKSYDETVDAEERTRSSQAMNGKEDIESEKMSTGHLVASFARTHFPFFVDSQINSSTAFPPAQIFLENAGGAQVPYQVIQSVSLSLSHRNRSVIGTRVKDVARETLSTILGASVEEHMIFLGANASSLFQKLAYLYVETGLLSSGDEVIVSTENHLANVAPWLMAASSAGAKVKWWYVEGLANTKRHERKELECSHDLRNLLSNKTRILVVSHASNILGQVRDIKTICMLAKECSGGYAHVVADGVAAVPHLSPSVSSSGVDWYAISCHKLFGPHIGALCGRRKVVESLGTKIDGHPCDETLYKMLETGTINYEACAGVYGLGRYFRALATFSDHQPASTPLQTRNQCTEAQQDRRENPLPQRSSHRSLAAESNGEELTARHVAEAYNRIKMSETPLINVLYKRLKSCDNVRIIESTGNICMARLPVFSFLHLRIPSSEIVQKCSDAGIVCRQSSFLSTDALQESFEFGAGSRQREDALRTNEGVVRVSLVHYNMLNEVNHLMETLESLPQWWEAT